VGDGVIPDHWRDLRAEEVPVEAIPAALGELARLQAELQLRLLAAGREKGRPAAPPERDRLVTLNEAAEMLGVTVSWLRTHKESYPFFLRLTSKTHRFSEAGIRKWLAKTDRRR
jgi:predicted DNA-binding transcriptional regulator AlpA